jgi:hypothetical protein
VGTPESAARSAFFDTIEWRELVGKRVVYVRTHLMPLQQDMKSLLMALVVDCQESITTSLFGSAGKRPVLLDLVSPKYPQHRVVIVSIVL